MKRLLEVLIPTYNRPALLYKLLKSALDLALKDVFFIVIDDGSAVIEEIKGIGPCSVKQVCESFNSSAVIYFRHAVNQGLTHSWLTYHKTYCQAKYVMAIVDKDVFIDKTPILNALNQLENDEQIAMVVLPIRQVDRLNEDLLIDFDYTRMSGKHFISKFVSDASLQHCTNYGIMRVESIKAAKVPDSLNLTQYGLSDAFGIDIDFVLRIASQGDVAFETLPHIKKNTMNGATERYPLTFAYTYYQYAKRLMATLRKNNKISKTDAKKYIQHWLLLILRGCVVSYRPVHEITLDKGVTGIKKHLYLPLHLYLIKELLKYRVKPNKEMGDLFFLSFRLMLNARFRFSPSTLIKKQIAKLKEKVKTLAVYITGRTALDVAPTIAMQEGLNAAILFLKNKYRYFKPATVKFWIYLYEYLIQLNSDPLTCDPNKKNLIVHFCCWGDDYTNKAIHYLLPSFNHFSDVGSHRLILMIHCDARAEEKFRRASVMKGLEDNQIIVKFYILPQMLLKACWSSYHYPNFSYFKRVNRVFSNNKYFLLGGLQNHALNLALKNKAYVSFMMPDFLLSASFFKEAFSQIKDKTMVVSTTFRTDYQKVKESLDTYYTEDNKNILSIPPAMLASLQVENIHSAAKRRVVSEFTQNFVPTPQLIFEHFNGYVIRAFHYHPVLIDCSKINHDVKLNHMPIDYLMLNQLLNPHTPLENQIWVCDDASKMSMMELSEADIEEHHYIKRDEYTESELTQLILETIKHAPSVYDSFLNQYFISIRHFILSKDYCQPDVSIDDDRFFNNINKLLTE